MTDQPYLSPDLANRLAAIDIGSNSIRLVVAEAVRDGRYRMLDDERESTRLGRTLATTGELDDASIEASLACLRRFAKITEGFQVETIRAIATCAVREATNGPEFCERVQNEIGLDVEVISPLKEAHLAFHSVLRRFDLSGKNTLLADIGGGSTELVVASSQVVEAIYATDLGAVRLSQKFGSGQAMVGHDYDRMVKWIDRRLRKKTDRPVPPPHLLIGSGGTFTSLASMMMARKNQQGLPVRGYQVSRAELKHLLDALRKMSPKARRGVPGLTADRTDIIVAGLAIIDRIMRRFRANTLQVHNRGVRDGLILRMIEAAQGKKGHAPVDRTAAVGRFAMACGSDDAHGQHVARLAGEMFSQLVESFQLVPTDQWLVEAAARLQDVGYLIDYDRHHKHSYHLILHSQLEGITPEELEIVANVARYHRGGEPKKKHAHFQRLDRQSRKRVRQLAAILRIAGGLDRSHSQIVDGVTMEVHHGGVDMSVKSPSFPEVDLWGARRRAGLFEKVFDAPLTIEWAENV